MRPSVVASSALPLLLTMLTTWMAFSPTTSYSQRLDWKLEDFKPLTELPWDEDLTVPVDRVILSLFREPDQGVRMLLLDEYLRAVPAEKLGAAFDLCLQYEGTQRPDFLVEFFISIWAERAPVACWKRVKELFKVVGIENSWLNYDGWKERDRITVQDREAIKASKFWLRSQALTSFREGLEKSNLPRAERARYLKEFADTWINAFGEWPSEPKSGYTPEIARPLSEVFWSDPEGRQWFIFESHVKDSYPLEIAVRRFIRAVPSEAPRVVKHLWSQKWQGQEGNTSQLPMVPSRAAFQVWVDADLAGMTRWVDALEERKSTNWEERSLAQQHVYMPKGLLMSRVDARMRGRWIASARKNDALGDLLSEWAWSDPMAALDAAVKNQDAEILEDVVRDLAYGPQGGQPWNTSHPGLGFVRDFDFSILPDETFNLVVGEGAITIMEQWGNIDVAEAAQFGLKHLFKLIGTDGRPEILAFFRGETDEFADNGGVLDRTFCALRVWAVTKPDEMKGWIATLKEEDLRTSLTWLLENPWGTGEGPERQ